MWASIKRLLGFPPTPSPAPHQVEVEGLGAGVMVDAETWCFPWHGVDLHIYGFEEGPEPELLPLVDDLATLLRCIPQYLEGEARDDVDGQEDEIRSLSVASVHLWGTREGQPFGMIYFADRPSGWVWRCDFQGDELYALGFDR